MLYLISNKKIQNHFRSNMCSQLCEIAKYLGAFFIFLRFNGLFGNWRPDFLFFSLSGFLWVVPQRGHKCNKFFSVPGISAIRGYFMGRVLQQFLLCLSTLVILCREIRLYLQYICTKVVNLISVLKQYMILSLSWYVLKVILVLV